MKIHFIPLVWIERAAQSCAICHSYLVYEDERQAERRWFDRRLQERAESDRRQAERRSTEVAEAVHDYLLDFCTPELRARLERQFNTVSIPIARESTRFAKAA